MSVAAIVNPLSPTSEILLFYCTEFANLALEHRPLGNTQFEVYLDNGTANSLGKIKQPCQFSVIRHNNSVRDLPYQRELQAAPNSKSQLTPGILVCRSTSMASVLW
jgi:hypothetical protein